MGRPSKYSVELRERAVRMVAEVRPDHDSEYQAISHVAKLLGVGSLETVRQWIRRMQVDTGARAGVTSEAQEEIKRLKRENAERRHNAIARLPAINDRFRRHLGWSPCSFGRRPMRRSEDALSAPHG